MTVLATLKEKALELRKARNPIAPKITFAISEVEKIGKNAGNRETTEDEAVKVVQKLVAVIDENLKHSTSDGMSVSLNFEKNILLSVLPEMVSEKDIQNTLVEFMTNREDKSKAPNKGDIMKHIRAKYGATVDMKRVGEILKDIYGI